MYQTKTSRFNREEIKPHSIFFAEHYDFNGYKVGHYFYCIYVQSKDKNNGLFRDIVGLLITTKEAQGYACPIILNTKQAYVCCDRATRFICDDKNVSLKVFKPSNKEKKAIIKNYAKYTKEILRQIKKGGE